MENSTSSTSEVETIGEALRVVVMTANRFRYAVAREHDLGIRDAALMAYLRDAGGRLTPGDLAERLLVTSGTLTAILRRLEARDLVARRPHPDDQRATIVTLQPAGEHVADRVRDHLHNVAATLLADPALDRQALLSSLYAAAAGLGAEALIMPAP
jgi:DNA-binding MarR family transcriptional regulator